MPLESVAMSIASSAAGLLCGPIIHNMYHFKSNVEKLKKKAKELEQRKKGVEDDVKIAENQGKLIKVEVTKWLDDVKDVAERLERITDEGNLSWYTGFFRYSDSMEAPMVIEEVAELLQKFFRIVGDYDLDIPGIITDGYDNDFASRKSIFDDVMKTLKETDIKAIGLHGMGGVGKTTLVKQVYAQLTQDKRLFGQVVMAEVSQNPDPKRIQQAIADRLALQFPEKENADARAVRLWQRLEKEKSILVILDDVWQELDLKNLGIPFGNAAQTHCKILVTSRRKNVCRIMKCEKYISVKPLFYDEAWVLFWKTVDDGENQSHSKPIAESIVKKCGGLPVAILAIAKTLKDSDHFVWNKVSNELAKFDEVPDFYPVLKLSYDYLKNEKAKLLFLLFGLHEVGHPVLIDHLVRCVIGLGFLQCVTTLKAVRDDVDQLIKVLKNANLLLDSDRKDEVKVHDVIHVVAQKIASTEHKMFNIQDVHYLNEELEKDIYKDSTAISLHHGEVPMLLEKLDFPQLKLLLLHSRSYYQNIEIPDHFLDGMKELKVLVLNRVHLQSFIPSLNYESNIRTLSLKCYNLKNITKVGMLKKLEVLTFSGIHVKRLPEEIGDLTRLKLLDLEGCYWLEEIPPNVISKLTRLEELYVSDSFVNWNTPGNASLIELKQLEDLTILCIHIMDANIIPQDFFLGKLEGFKIFIGEAWRLNAFEEREMSRVLRLKLSHKNYLQSGVEKLMQKTEGLFLDEIDGIRNVHPKLSGKGFPDLKHLCILDNSHLEKLCDGDSREEPFTMLKEIDVEHCPHLKFMFSSSMVNSLQQLEEIRVKDCELMEVIIKKEGSSGDSISFFDEKKLCHGDSSEEPFRKLRVIVVQRCAVLTQLISSSMTRLEEIEVIDCPHLKFMFSSSMVNSLQQLEEIRVKDCESMEVIIKKEGSSGENNFNSISFFDKKKLCHGDSREEPFRKLRVIDVQRCAAMTQLISSSMTRLEEIEVIDCENLIEIVGNNVLDDSITISEIVFTELHTLTLDGLPKLMNFGPTAISRTLENIQEGDHEDLKSLFDNKVSFPSLKNLSLSSLNIPNIWCNQLPSSYSFGETLTSLDVEHCPHLKFLFSSSMVNGLQQLEELRVANCESMEVIINKEGSSGENNFNSISFFDEKVCDSVEEILDVPEGSSSMEGNTIPMIVFPKLTLLSLSGLRKLKSFYNGLHISEWSSLKELSVESCDRVEIFGSEYQSLCEEKQSVPQPLFIVDKYTFPRLDELELRDNDNLKEIWHGGGIISNKLQFRGKTNIIKFPHYLLATDTLDVSSGYFKQIGGGSDNTFAAALSQLRTLRVSGDDDDDDDDDSLHDSFESCDSLACLVSSWVSFQNLTKLDITCGFRYLLTYSTATSLQHLTQLKISDCKQIEVIIMPPTNEVNDKIVFSQLKNLRLINLDSLTSFYSGSHTLEFPSLEIMVVCRCPNMEVFSEGDSITQKLQRIQLHEYYDYDRHLFVDDYDEWRWEGDLNSTIQKMCKEMAGFKDLKKFRLSKFPWLKEVWHDQVSFNSFPCLESLTVDKCADMSSAIPLNLLPCLESLYRLTIEDCDSLEEVIHTEGLDDDDQSVLLPWLHTIQLIELPRLRNVWSKHHLEILGFTHLSFFSVSKCNNLQYIFTTKVILNLKLLVRVEIRDCAMLETIITEDREKDATMSDIVLPWLRFITLEYLPKLTCFHSGSNILKCSVFETMTINDCPQMKAFVFTSTEDHDLQNTPLFSEKVAFPNLKKLELSKLPMVEHLWNEPCRVFQCLETIEISECVILKSLVPSSTSLQSLTTLKISQCDGLTSLMTLPTAKSLEQLDEINVADCKNMQEIITHIHIEDEENDGVVFGQLYYIGLHCLPNITGFYLGDYTIEFPDLEQVVVSQCQKMNTFSKGAMSTPNLKMVQRTDDEEEGRWQNDLNTTIQLLFEETNAQNQKED